MALARFFGRVFAAAGRTLSVSRESLEQQLNHKVVGIRCADRPGQNEEWIGDLLVNLFARLYPRIVLDATPATRERLSSIARGINPAVELCDSSTAADIAVCIGNVSSGGRNELFARADGWVARVSLRPRDGSPGPANPYAAAASAALAAAETFRSLFRANVPAFIEGRDVSLSLLDYGTSSGHDLPLAETSIGECAFFGLGAVANGALWALGRHASLGGTVHLVDAERIETSNLQRYVLAMDRHDGSPKTVVAADALARTRLSTIGHPERLEQFADRFPCGFTLPLVCVSVDNIEGRRVTQALLPRLVVNGFTSDSGLGVSWHELSRPAACLACHYQPRGPAPSQTDMMAAALGLPPDRVIALLVSNAPPSNDELRDMAGHIGVPPQSLNTWRGKPLSEIYTGLVCGSVALDLRGVGRFEAVPLAHQSALAGILMAAELVKRTTPELRDRIQTDTLAVWEDVLRPPPPRWTQPRPREPGCICGDADYQRAYAERWITST